mmetsp:Transcript_9682/g.23823  ORF Transcript_9682/g.23823 Transcript_9682/m.23823 type:complete len:155 (-) Transcript_9682:303-767(-)
MVNDVVLGVLLVIGLALGRILIAVLSARRIRCRNLHSDGNHVEYESSHPSLGDDATASDLPLTTDPEKLSTQNDVSINVKETSLPEENEESKVNISDIWISDFIENHDQKPPELKISSSSSPGSSCFDPIEAGTYEESGSPIIESADTLTAYSP